MYCCHCPLYQLHYRYFLASITLSSSVNLKGRLVNYTTEKKWHGSEKKLEHFQQFLQRNSELLSLLQRVHRHLWIRPDFLGAVFACGYSGVRVAAFFFCEKLAHFLAFVAKVVVVSAEASQSKKKERMV